MASPVKLRLEYEDGHAVEVDYDGLPDADLFDLYERALVSLVIERAKWRGGVVVVIGRVQIAAEADAWLEAHEPTTPAEPPVPTS